MTKIRQRIKSVKVATVAVAWWRRPEASRTSLNVLIIRPYCHYGSLPSLIVHAGTHRNCLKFLNGLLFQICDPKSPELPHVLQVAVCHDFRCQLFGLNSLEITLAALVFILRNVYQYFSGSI